MASRIVQYFADKLKTVKDYPITLTKAVYDENGNRLDNKLQEIEGNVSQLDTNLTIKYNLETDMIQLYTADGWVNWKSAGYKELWLYNNGNEFYDTTGYFKSLCTDRHGNASNSSVTKNSDHITMYSAPVSYQGLVCYTYNIINFKDYNKLYIESTASNYGVVVCVMPTRPTTADISGFTKIGELPVSDTKTITEIDLSGLTTDYYLVFYRWVSTDAYTATTNVYRIWITK